jgi:hypothetical protein
MLSAGSAVAVAILAVWLADFDVRDARGDAAVADVATSLAALGLFLTWGDGGSRVRNAAKSLLALLALIAGAVALLLWNATTAGKAS